MTPIHNTQVSFYFTDLFQSDESVSSLLNSDRFFLPILNQSTPQEVVHKWRPI